MFPCEIKSRLKVWFLAAAAGECESLQRMTLTEAGAIYTGERMKLCKSTTERERGEDAISGNDSFVGCDKA